MTQRFIQLTDSILLEMRYTNPVSPETHDYNITRIVNNHLDGAIQIMNEDSAMDETGNVRERASVQTGSGTYTDTDKDQTPDWLTYDESLGNLAVTNVTASNTPYDEFRFHIVSGYNFEDKDGVIAQVKIQERSGKIMQLANVVFLKDADFFEFNPRPIWLGDRLYDRYFTCKVPAVKLINDIFYSLEGNPSQSSTLVAKLTSNGEGFLRANPLQVSIIDINSTREEFIGGARYKHFDIGGIKTVPLNQSDEFALLSAVIQPSEAGDYFEYFASWAGGFIEDFLLNANNLPGNNYIVLHEIRVFEQQGSVFVETDVLQMIQESDFDKPKKFRPILDNADNAVSFTLEYTTRLLNKADSSQILRTANHTSYTPKDWGRYIQKLNLLNDPEPFQVYNKVVDGPSFANDAFTLEAEAQPFNTKYVPSFFDRFAINVNNASVILDKDGLLTTDKTSTTSLVFGQGECRVIVNPFDNFLKFTILKTNGSETPTPLDLGGSAAYFISFVNNQNKKVRFESVSDPLLADPSKGDILFKISEADSNQILLYKTREFYILSKFEGGNETQMYQGLWHLPSEIAAVKTAYDAIEVAQSSVIEKKISEITTKQQDIIDATNTLKNSPAATQATAISTKIEIPGQNNTVPTGVKNSIVSNIVPVSETKKSASTKATDAKLKAQADKNKKTN